MELQAIWSRLAEEPAAVGVLGALLLLSLSVLSLLSLRRQPKLKLPPSPAFSLPFLGHVLHVGHIGRDVYLQELRKKLGPIFSLHIGRTPVIYITSAALAHEALVQKGQVFAARPFIPSRVLFTNNFRNINSASYGPHWRAVRRNLVQEVLGVPKIAAFRPIRIVALDDMISHMGAEARHNDGVIPVYSILRDTMFRLLLFMCFGYHMPAETRSQITAFTEEFLLYQVGTLEDFYPFLSIFNKKKWQKVRTLRDRQVELYSFFIEKHKELKKLGELAPGSYLESLFNLDDGLKLSLDDLVSLCAEFTAVGTDTTVTSLEWAMARLVDNPSIQGKIYDEIHSIMGDELVDEKDLPQFPYLHAFVKESLRLNPPGNFTLPHGISKHCTVGGYDIPPNAIVQFDIQCIGKDPEIWEDALEFKPERFFTRNVDMTGAKEMTMIPFGAGRRICPGLALATMHMELIVARLLQAFEWLPFPAGSKVDFTEQIYFTVHMKYPLKAHLKERKSPSKVSVE